MQSRRSVLEASPNEADHCPTDEPMSGRIQRLVALGEMTGGIVHDIRNILTVIDAGLRLAEREAVKPEVRAYIAGAREGVSRGVALTSQLLPSAKARSLDPERGQVNSLLARIEPLLRAGAGGQVQLVFDLAPDLPDCAMEEAQFTAAMLNLVINARDAMPSGGQVQISTRRNSATYASQSLKPGEYVVVRVADQGVGMSDEVLKRIFDPLFTTKGPRGSGLGLPQVFSFMRSIGGDVCARSIPMSGTEVDLLFPTVPAVSS